MGPLPPIHPHPGPPLNLPLKGGGLRFEGEGVVGGGLVGGPLCLWAGVPPHSPCVRFAPRPLSLSERGRDGLE